MRILLVEDHVKTGDYVKQGLAEVLTRAVWAHA